jgi:hypothetical protein
MPCICAHRSTVASGTPVLSLSGCRVVTHVEDVSAEAEAGAASASNSRFHVSAEPTRTTVTQHRHESHVGSEPTECGGGGNRTRARFRSAAVRRAIVTEPYRLMHKAAMSIPYTGLNVWHPTRAEKKSTLVAFAYATTGAASRARSASS